jgi:hypothetical protein
MLRKIGLVVIAAASLGAAALAPTSAPPGTAVVGTAAGIAAGAAPACWSAGRPMLAAMVPAVARAAIGPDPLGPALAPDQPLLLIGTAGSRVQKSQSRVRLGLCLV